MSNLIYRQDAIELVRNSYYNLAESMEDTWAMVADVENLPPAEPEIIRCKDCKYYYNTNPKNIPTANIICFQMHEDDYCSYAERRTE